MRRGRPAGVASPYRALAHHHHHQQQVPSDSTLIRSFDVEANPARPVRPSPLATSVIRDMPLDLVDRIRSFPLFQSAPGEFLIAIGNHLKPQIHAPNDHVVTEGDDAKAMYWLVRGVVAVTSRDGEAVYAELQPGAFFGEIGVLMNMPRTATIVARTKCLLLVLKKEDLQLVLPRFPDMERAILEEAQERLNLLKKKRIEKSAGVAQFSQQRWSGIEVAAVDATDEVSTGESGAIRDGAVVKNPKKRKSPSPGIIEDPASGGSAIGSGLVNIRKTLKELPLFSTLPPDILHFLGLSVAPMTFPPFTDVIRQGSSGNEIYFIVQGEAEVVHRDQPASPPDDAVAISPFQPRPRLKAGQYFGEVASLGLSAGRTATVRSITTVECLVVPGETLEELWRRCPPSIRSQVEKTARERYSEVRRTSGPWDVNMADAGRTDKESKLSDAPKTPPKTPSPATSRGYVAASLFTTPSRNETSPTGKDDKTEIMGFKDPDPFRSVDMENLRNRRRQSLVSPSNAPLPAENAVVTTYGRSRGISRPRLFTDVTPPPLRPESPTEIGSAVRAKRARTLPSQRTVKAEACDVKVSTASPAVVAARSDDILVRVFKYLDVGELIRLRLVSKRWRLILETSPLVCNDVDLSRYSRSVNDDVIVGILGPFINTRAASVDLNGCFHVTDRGFSALWSSCGKNVTRWRMRSVWDVSATQILEMSENAKSLEELDWSNCRKVGDNLLARVVGWVIPAKKGDVAQTPSNSTCDSKKRSKAGSKAPNDSDGNDVARNGHGGSEASGSNTVIGCPRLSKLDLSYCKHVTDRSMVHLAVHASNRLRWLSLTRCTSITDAGFQAWARHKFERLTHLCLADCTYLSDSAIVALVGAAKQLTHLDLSFCCALSDTSTEVVALGLPKLRELRLAFCGSAVSDGSLQSIALHLCQLEGLSVRGCVRVTGRGLESVLEGCARLRWVDVSQCRNLEDWLRSGNVVKWGFDDRIKKPPPEAAASCGRGGLGAMLIPSAPPTLSVAKMLATPGILPRSYLGGLYPGRRTKRQPAPARFAQLSKTAARSFQKPSSTAILRPRIAAQAASRNAFSRGIGQRSYHNDALSQQQSMTSGPGLRKLMIGGAIFGGTLLAVNFVFNRETRDDGGMPEYEREYLNSTFLHTGLGLGIIGLTARQMVRTGFVYRLMVTNPWLVGIGGLALSFGTMIGTRSISPDNYIPKYALWTAFNATQAAFVAPLLAFVPMPLLARAGLYTVGVMGALSLIGATAKQEKYLYIGGPLLAGAAVVALSGLAPLALPATALRTLAVTEKLWLYGGLAVFGGFTLYDVQKILYHARLAQAGMIKRDAVNESISLELDFLNIFIRLVQIMMMNQSRK
ncbi:hypothetical protein CP533_6514 [Ophiocordyceps camponoti-saundersi (nom. inval.)]|nr:hypothetical protein CP533_6514 [Ophiocordyceps camponoti-saundersi (nom. inval.)]